jgi:hypothetical protein
MEYNVSEASTVCFTTESPGENPAGMNWFTLIESEEVLLTFVEFTSGD